MNIRYRRPPTARITRQAATRDIARQIVGDCVPPCTHFAIEEPLGYIIVNLHEPWWRRWLVFPAASTRRLVKERLTQAKAVGVRVLVRTVKL